MKICRQSILSHSLHIITYKIEVNFPQFFKNRTLLNGKHFGVQRMLLAFLKSSLEECVFPCSCLNQFTTEATVLIPIIQKLVFTVYKSKTGPPVIPSID